MKPGCHTDGLKHRVTTTTTVNCIIINHLIIAIVASLRHVFVTNTCWRHPPPSQTPRHDITQLSRHASSAVIFSALHGTLTSVVMTWHLTASGEMSFWKVSLIENLNFTDIFSCLLLLWDFVMSVVWVLCCSCHHYYSICEIYDVKDCNHELKK